MSSKKTVVIGASSILVTKADYQSRLGFERFFSFCDKFLPGCGCDVVVLPEMYAHLPEDRQPIDGPHARRFGELAKRHQLHLVAPHMELAGGKTYVTQAVFAPSGDLIFKYRKVHRAEADVGKASDPFTSGDRFDVFDLPWFRAGLMICFDNQYPESARELALQGAQVIFWPSAGDLEKPHRNAARCLDNHIYLVGASIPEINEAHPDAIWEPGMIMDPYGKILATTRCKDGIAKAELPLGEDGRIVPPGLSKNTFSHDINYLETRRPEAYRLQTGNKSQRAK